MSFVLWGTRMHPYAFVIGAVALIILSLGINFKRLNFTWPHLLLPVTYLLAVACVFAIIPNPRLRLVFLIVSAIIFYFLEIKLGHESHFLQNIFLLSSFGVILGLFAVEFYLHPQIYGFLPLVFAITYLLAIQGFAGFALSAKKYFYFLTTLVVTEAAWGLTFWPTHYFVDAVVLFCVFYALWLFAFSAFFGKLSRAKIFWQLSVIAVVLILTLTTAAWRPLR